MSHGSLGWPARERCRRHRARPATQHLRCDPSGPSPLLGDRISLDGTDPEPGSGGGGHRQGRHHTAPSRLIHTCPAVRARMGIRARIPDSWRARQKLSIPARPDTFLPIQRAATAKGGSRGGGQPGNAPPRRSTGGRRGGGAPGPWPHLWLVKVGPYCHMAPPLT